MRRRIMALVVGMTALVVLAFAIPLTVLIRHNIHDTASKSLQGYANGLARYVGGYQAPTTGQIAAELARATHDRRASVQIASAKPLGVVPPGGLPPAPPSAGRPGARTIGSGGPDGDGAPQQPQLRSWHGGQVAQLQTMTRSGPALIRVYESNRELYSAQTAPLLVLGAASLGLLLLGAIAGELVTRRIVRPLIDSADTARRLAAGDVTARASTNGPPEVAEVGRALNRLADRIDELIADERETVADLSHRLRTPLTALRLDAEVLRDPADAARVGAHVGNLERMLTAVIRSARRPQREGRLPSCDATAVVRERVDFWSALAEDQNRVATVELAKGPLPVRAGAEDLAAAVDALLENVIAHTPEGVPFTVRLGADGPGAQLEIADEGPGLPADAPTRGRSDRGSSGLGLDIARRCAEASGGALTLGTAASGGALVTLRLGAP